MFLVFDVHLRSVSPVEKQKQPSRLCTNLALLAATGALIYLNYSNFLASVNGESYFGGWPLHAYWYCPQQEYSHRFEARELFVDVAITLSILYCVRRIGIGITSAIARNGALAWPRIHLSTLLAMMFAVALVLMPLNAAPHALGERGYIGYEGFYVWYGWPMPAYASLEDGRARILYAHIIIDTAIAAILCYFVYRIFERRIAMRVSAHD